MTAPAVYVCDEAEARDLTEQIKGSVEKTHRLLLHSQEWKAWAALGYGSWREYAMTEFGLSQSAAYRLLDMAKVVREIEAAGQFPDLGNVVTPQMAADIKPHLPAVAEAVRQAVADVPEVDRPAAAAAAVKAAREQYRPHPSPAATAAAPTAAGDAAKVTHTTVEEFVADRQTGEVMSVEDWQSRDPVAAARAEVARQPVIVTEKAVDRLRTARLTFEAAGSPADVIADLANSNPDTDNTGFWLAEIDSAMAVLNGLAVALRRRNLRSVSR